MRKKKKLRLRFKCMICKEPSYYIQCDKCKTMMSKDVDDDKRFDE